MCIFTIVPEKPEKVEKHNFSQHNIFTKEYLHEKPINTLNLWLMLPTEKKKYIISWNQERHCVLYVLTLIVCYLLRAEQNQNQIQPSSLALGQFDSGTGVE